MLSLSPLQMTGLQAQQAAPLNGPDPSQRGRGGSSNNQLAELAMSGGGVPWSNLYDNLQTEYWNRLLRDPNTGDIANVSVRDKLPTRYEMDLTHADNPVKKAVGVEYSDPYDISVLDYLKNMEKYSEFVPPEDPYGVGSSEGYYTTGGASGPLAEYFNALLVDGQRNLGHSFTLDKQWDQYGDSLIDYLSNEGVDLSVTKPWDRNPLGTDYESVSGRYLNDYLNKWVYNGSIADAPSVKKFGDGAEKIRWFADDPALQQSLARGDMRGANPSMFATVNDTLGAYASGQGRSYNPDKDETFTKWKDYGQQIRKSESKSAKAGRIAPLAMMASMFIPGLGPALGGALGLSGTTASVVGSGLMGGAIGGLSSAYMGDGFGKGFLKGGLTSGIGAGLGSYFGGMNSFSAENAAQLASQGINPGQIADILGQSGVGAGAAGLYGNLSSMGLTNPAWASGAAKLIGGGIQSLVSGNKFDPRSVIGSSIASGILPGNLQWASPLVGSALTGNKSNPLSAISKMGGSMMTAMR